MKKKLNKRNYKPEIKLTLKAFAISLSISVIALFMEITAGNDLLSCLKGCLAVSIIPFGISAWILIYKFIERYFDQHPEKFYGGKVYRVNLSSITHDITVYNNRSKSSNISNAESQVIDTIMIQETSSNKYYREIITGDLIPISTVIYVIEGFEVVATNKLYSNSCLYVYLSKECWRDNGAFLGYCVDPRQDATSNEIEQYIQERAKGYKGFPSFESYLDHLYERAESYYNQAKQKGEISDEQKTKKILEYLQKTNRVAK